MASPNTLKLQEERKALRQGTVKVSNPFLIYGANRQTRRAQLRQVYKEGFLSYEEAKRAVREEDRKKLQSFSKFTRFVKAQISLIQAEFAQNGSTLSEAQAFNVLKERAAKGDKQIEAGAKEALEQDEREEVLSDDQTADAAPV